MSDYNYPPSATLQQVADMIAAGSNFVAGGSAMSIADLMANYPAGIAYKGQYARVNNLYNGTSAAATGGLDDVLRCRFDDTNSVYRWVPQREAFNLTMSPTSGSTTLTPLVTPPTIRLAGTLLGNLSVSPLATNAYIGQKFTVIQNSTLGLFVTQITGLIGSNLTLLGNTAQELEYTATGWAKATP